MSIGETLTEEVENEEVENQNEQDNNASVDDDTAPLDENIDENVDEDTSIESNEDLEDSQEKPSKGIDKRISKVLSDNEKLKTELWGLRRQLEMVNNPAHAQQGLNQQYEQPKHLDPRLDPQSDQFDLIFFTRMQVREEVIQATQAERMKIEQQEMAKSVQSDCMSVIQNINKARANDPSFDKTMQNFEKIFTPDMIYGLSNLQNPSAYLKHVFKNEKDVRAFLQLPKKHPSEQVKLISKFGLQFEYQNRGQKPSASSTKPKPIPQIGKGNAYGSKPSYNEKTGEFDRKFINDFINN